VVVVRPGVSEDEVQGWAARLKTRLTRNIQEYRLYLFTLPETEGKDPKTQMAEAISY
jgi:hypothetical protein